MTTIFNAMFNICQLEESARQKHWINQIHPVVKVFATLAYIIILTSLDKYQLNKAIMLGLYPIALISISNIPIKEMLGKMILPILFGISLGVLNPYFDREIVYITQNIYVTGGIISFFTLLMKATFSVLATLILVATTKIEDIGSALNQLKVPAMLTTLLLLTFRYINIFVKEIEKTMTAYRYRDHNATAIKMSTWGSLVGQIIMRAFDRSMILYEAMLLRGFSGSFITVRQSIKFKDLAYLALVLCLIGYIRIR